MVLKARPAFFACPGGSSCGMAWLGKLKVAAAARAAGSAAAPKPLERRHTPLCDDGQGRVIVRDFSDGSFLQKWCNRCTAIAIKEVGRPALPDTMVQSVTSLCTGSGMDHMVLDACAHSFQRESIPISFVVPVTCEMHKEKALWTQSLRKCMQTGGDIHCNFTALQDAALHSQML